VRNLLLKIFFVLGGFHVWRFFQRNKVVILCLHGVMDEELPASWVPLRSQYSRSSLDSALLLLKKYYQFVSLAEAIAMLNGERKLTPYSMVLTFDDGYLNNKRHALPILKKHGVPSVMYIACSHVEHRKPFWFDRLDYAIQHADMNAVNIQMNGMQIEFESGDVGSLKRSFKKLRDRAKHGDRDDSEMLAELDALSDRLERESGRRLADIFESDDWSCVMTWDHIAELANEPLVEIGSHTVNHIRLGKVQREVVMRELLESKATIENRTSIPCLHFCYPDGSTNSETSNCVAEAGYASAVTTRPGLNSVSCNPYRLNRIHLPESDDAYRVLFVASGLADAIASLRG
jgi:peptidoglycan/xylan/chitin deacetylase (PgdA/CDA1 family)